MTTKLPPRWFAAASGLKEGRPWNRQTRRMGGRERDEKTGITTYLLLVANDAQLVAKRKGNKQPDAGVGAEKSMFLRSEVEETCLLSGGLEVPRELGSRNGEGWNDGKKRGAARLLRGVEQTGAMYVRTKPSNDKMVGVG